MDPAIHEILTDLQQMLFVDFMPLIKTIIILFTTTKALENYSLHRDYFPKNISKVLLPPDLIEVAPHIDEKKLIRLRYGEKVLAFAHKLIDVFPREVLTNFYYNIGDVRITDLEKKHFVVSPNTSGTHDASTNIIRIDEKYANSTIYHELFHMASSRYEDGVVYSGFSQSFGFLERDIGDGINEGYTELMTDRYFCLDKTSAFTYRYLEDVTEHLEKIVGKDKMEVLYLKADLNGLIDELTQYATEDEIMAFLTSTDFILAHLADYSFKPFEKKMLTNSLKTTNMFLIKTFVRKMAMHTVNNRFEKGDEHLVELAQFIASMNTKFIYHNVRYDIMSEEDINSYIDDSISGNNISIHFAEDDRLQVIRGR